MSDKVIDSGKKLDGPTDTATPVTDPAAPVTSSSTDTTTPVPVIDDKGVDPAAPVTGSSTDTTTPAPVIDDKGVDTAPDDKGVDTTPDDNGVDTKPDDNGNSNAATATPAAPSATTAVTVTKGDDGFEHRHADLSNREVHGTEDSNNAIRGSTGDDVITGGSLSDVLEGGSGSDDLSAGSGDDILVGGGSDDVGLNHLDGGAGDDTLVAGGHKTKAFDDFMATHDAVNKTVHTDAKYADVASIADDSSTSSVTQVENHFVIHSGNGRDMIFNFHAATDKIVLDRELNGSTIKDAASLMEHLVIDDSIVSLDLGHGNSIILIGVDASSLSEANFVIV